MHLAGLRVLKHLSKKKIFSFIFTSLHFSSSFIFSLHLLSLSLFHHLSLSLFSHLLSLFSSSLSLVLSSLLLSGLPLSSLSLVIHLSSLLSLVLYHLLLSFIFFSCLLFSCLVSPLSSSLVSSLLSFIFSCLLVLYHLLLSFLSCLVSLSCPVSLSLSSSLSLSLSVSLCLSLSVSLSVCRSLCLRVMLCVVSCGVCRCGRGVVGGRGVCLVCVLWHVEKTWKNRIWLQKRLRVYIQNVPVYAGTTRTCVETCARGAGTHGDVLNRTHGDVLNPHTGAGGHRQFCLPKFAHVRLSRASEVHERNFWIFPIFKCENRSRTTCPRILQSFAFPDKAVQFQLS